ncbi:MAG: hypothetical protein ABR941_05745 [Thermoleophilia bacterium]
MTKHVIHIKLTQKGWTNHQQPDEVMTYLEHVWRDYEGGAIEVLATHDEYGYLVIDSASEKTHLGCLLYLRGTGDFEAKSYTAHTVEEVRANKTDTVRKPRN